MSPTKTITTIKGIRHTRESVSGQSFTLSPQELMNLIGISSKSTLFRHEKDLGLAPRRDLDGERIYSDPEILALAKNSQSVNINYGSDQVIITGRTGNKAFLPKQ